MTTTENYWQTYQEIRQQIGGGRGVLRYTENGEMRTFSTDGVCVVDGAWDICYKMLGAVDAPWVLICSRADFVDFTATEA